MQDRERLRRKPGGGMSTHVDRNRRVATRFFAPCARSFRDRVVALARAGNAGPASEFTRPRPPGSVQVCQQFIPQYGIEDRNSGVDIPANRHDVTLGEQASQSCDAALFPV
jgi:hypothetical protein